MAHGVCADDADVVVLAGVRVAVAFYLLAHVVHELVADLHTKNHVLGEEGRQPEEQPPKPTPDINHRHLLRQLITSSLVIERRMLHRITINLQVILRRRTLEERRIVRFPINIGVMRREWEWGGVQGVDVRTHAVLGAFGHDSLDLYLLLALLLLVLDFLVLLRVVLLVALGVVALHLNGIKSKGEIIIFIKEMK